MGRKFYVSYMQDNQAKLKEFEYEQEARRFCEELAKEKEPSNLYMQEGIDFFERVDSYG